MATGGARRRVPLARVLSRRWAVWGLGGASLGLIVVLLVPLRFATVIGSALVLFGALAFVASMIASVVREELRRGADLVVETMERGTVDMLPPAKVLELVLTRAYGPSTFTRNVVTALLGGEGLAHDGADLTVSEHTEIDYELSRVDHKTYRLVMEERYSFRNRVPTASFVIFATSDHGLRDSIIGGARLPLFELWFVRDDLASPFEDSVESMRESVRVGMQYVDAQGEVRDVNACHPGGKMREVMVPDWGRYLSFFRRDQHGEQSIDRRQYMGKLRIFEVDLHGLAIAGTTVSTIQQLTVRSTTLQALKDGFCYWQAPYPCFVERMSFDTTYFDFDSETALWFHLKPFMMRSQEIPTTWTTGDKVVDLPFKEWALTGHGMALMWRPVS